jgi:hypothetical protein
MAAKFQMATNTKFAYVAKKTLACLRFFGWKKNLKLQNQKWTFNSRWPPKFELLLKFKNRYFYQVFFFCLIYKFYRIFFLEYSRWRLYSIWRFFWHLILGALIFVRNLKMVKILQIFEEQ